MILDDGVCNGPSNPFHPTLMSIVLFSNLFFSQLQTGVEKQCVYSPRLKSGRKKKVTHSNLRAACAVLYFMC